MSKANVAQFVGMDKMEAIKLADNLGYEWRITKEDGQYYMGTDDMDDNRVNFEIQRDIIIAADRG